MTEEEGMTVAELELENLRREASEYKDKYVRAIAEAENTRKRLAREQSEGAKHLVCEVICEVLQPIDQLEMALGHVDNASDEVKNWAIGFEMILNQFKEMLSSHGVEPFESVGHTFDPHFHEAVEMVEGEEDGLIVEEVARGYKMGDRVVRAARVKVSKKGEKDEPEE